MMRWRAEYLWLLLVVFVLLLSVWWLPGGSGLLTDSYSVSHAGKKVFYLTLQQMGYRVSRHTDELIPGTPEPSTLLILGPARYPTEEQWQALYQDVRAGSTLIVAASVSEPVADTGPFNIRMTWRDNPFSSAEESGDEPSASENDQNKENNQNGQSLEEDGENEETGQNHGEEGGQDGEDGGEPKPEESEKDSDEESQQEPETNEEAGEEPTFGTVGGSDQAETPLLDGTVEWVSKGRLEVDGRPSGISSAWETLVWLDEDLQAVRADIGRGAAIFVASDDIFSNRTMLEDEQALLAFRLVEAAPQVGPVYFDESLNSTGTPKVFGILFEPLFRLITLQLILLAVLFGWSGSRRFGPRQSLTTGHRRSVVEHAEALGNLYYRTGSGARAVECLYEYLKADLRNVFAGGSHRVNPEVLARQADVDPADVRELIAQVEAASRRDNVSSGKAADLLTRLAELRARVHGSNEQ